MTDLSAGRVNQKQRTRVALVKAAAELMRDRRNFSVADVADHAKVGRTTAYRYFPTLESLVAHAALFAITDVERRSVDSAAESLANPADRLRAVVESADRSVSSHENVFRAMLSVSLREDDSIPDVLPRRVGVRKALIDSAIGQLRGQLDKKRYDRLTAALSLFIGIEAAIVLKDVCQVSEGRARDIKIWAANALLEAALAEIGETSAPGSAAPPPAKTPRSGRTVKAES